MSCANFGVKKEDITTIAQQRCFVDKHIFQKCRKKTIPPSLNSQQGAMPSKTRPHKVGCDGIPGRFRVHARHVRPRWMLLKSGDRSPCSVSRQLVASGVTFKPFPFRTLHLCFEPKAGHLSFF